MKRSPLGAVSVWPLRLMLTPLRFCCTELTKMFCTAFDSPDTDSTKNTRVRFAVSPNTPGVTRETSSRASRRVVYCPAICAAQGEMKSESAVITAICGRAKSSTGFNHAVSDCPAPNQITISESRQLRVIVSSTEMNMVRESSTGSAPSAKKPRNANTASEGNLPPAAWPSRRMRRVVTAIANSVMNTAPARPANSLSSARWKIMRYFRPVEFSIKTLSPETAKTGCVVLGVYQDGELTAAARRVDQAAKGALKKALPDISGKTGSTLLLRALPGVAAERVLLVGLGEKSASESAYRDAVRAAANALKELDAKDAALFLVDMKVGSRPLGWNVRRAVLGIRDALYRFDQLKTQKKPAEPALQEVILPLSPKAELKNALDEAVATADGTALARTLGNLPPNICTPSYLAEEAKKLAREFKLEVEVLERKDMERLGMGALLAVARASHQPPKLIVLRYSGAAKGRKPLALVGKGITFDTGGISLKPAGEMDEMKFDMSGAASVLGTLRALAGMRAPVNVVGVIPTCENMPGGAASKPGDVVTSMSGQTVEILNTDAEGRLILCDALTYAARYEPEAVVDVATLTGACVIALGHVATGLFSNDEALAEEIRAAADDAWDRVWPMPLWEDYQEQLRSNFADFANIGGRPGGSITAACFLARFTREQRWAHLDIAGTAWKGGREKGSTGRPVPLLVRFALAHAGEK